MLPFLNFTDLAHRRDDDDYLLVAVLGKVLAEVNIAQLPATAIAWVAQRPTQHLSAGLVGELGDGFGVGGVQVGRCLLLE